MRKISYLASCTAIALCLAIAPVEAQIAYPTPNGHDSSGAAVAQCLNSAGQAVAFTGPYPCGATPLIASSGNKANASAAATLAAAAGVTNYISGFEITASGATAGLPVTVTVTGILGGTLSYTFAAPAGALVEATPLVVEFPVPLPASAVNTAIVVTLPALGSGNTNATVVVHGYQL